MQGVVREPGRLVNHILDPGRTCNLAKNRFTFPAFYECNIRGQPMEALATLLAYQVGVTMERVIRVITREWSNARIPCMCSTLIQHAAGYLGFPWCQSVDTVFRACPP